MNLERLVHGLRQQLFPAEFRIAAPAWSDEWLAALRALAESAPGEPGTRDSAEEAGRIELLTGLGTNVWRLRQRMLEPGASRPREQFRREYREVEAIWDMLAAAGMEIRDHAGQPFDPGLAIKVATYQPTAGIRRQRVAETIKPSIFLHGRHVQMAEVIVATPESTEQTPQAGEAVVDTDAISPADAENPTGPSVDRQAPPQTPTANPTKPKRNSKP